MQYHYYILRFFLAFTLVLGMVGAWGQKTTIYTIFSPPYNNYPTLIFNSDLKIGPIFDTNGTQYFIGIKFDDFGNSDYRIIKVDQGKITSIDIPYLMSSKDSQAPTRSVDFGLFSIDKKNNIWIKHNEEGSIYRMDSQGIWYAYYYNSEHLNRRVKTLPNLLSITMDRPLLFANDNNGKLWVFDNSAMIHNFDGNKWNKFVDLTNVSSEFLKGVVSVPSEGKLYKFLSMDVKNNNQIWITASGTGGQFALKVENSKMVGYAVNSKINNSTGKVYIDKSGGTWVFDGYQIAFFDTKNWYTYPIKNSYDGNDFILDYENNRKWYLDFNTNEVQTFQNYAITGNNITFPNNALSTFKLESNYLTNLATNPTDESLWGFWSNKLVEIKINSTVIPLSPAFSFTPTAPKVNQSVTFKDESMGSPISWAWDFGDGTTSTLQNPTKTYTKSGIYTVKFTISKTGATSQSISKSIEVLAPTLTLSKNTDNVAATASTGSLTLTTNNSWTASSNATWLKVSPTNGNAGTNLAINYTTDANTTTNARTGVITLSAGGLTQTFTVTQAGAVATTLTLSTDTKNIPATGETGGINLTTNNTWTASSNATWLKVSPVSGNAGTNIPIDYTIDANITSTARTGIITFTSGGTTKTFTVTQAGAGAATLKLSATSYTATADAFAQNLGLEASANWTAQSDASWLTISPTSGTAGVFNQIRYGGDANASTTQRVGTITFTSGTTTAKLVVTQARATAIGLAKDLIAHYPFTGNANNAIQNKYHGILGITATGSPSLTTDRNNITDRAYNFDGTQDNIELANMTEPFTNAAFSVSAWYITSTNDILGRAIFSTMKDTRNFYRVIASNVKLTQ